MQVKSHANVINLLMILKVDLTREMPVATRIDSPTEWMKAERPPLDSSDGLREQLALIYL